MGIQRIGRFEVPFHEVSGRRTFARMLKVRTDLTGTVGLKKDFDVEKVFGPNANTHAALVLLVHRSIMTVPDLNIDNLNALLSNSKNRDILRSIGFSAREGEFNAENLYQTIVGRLGDGDIFESKYGDEHKDIARSVSAILEGEVNAWDFINTEPAERSEKVVGLFAETWPVTALENAHRFSGQSWAEGIIKSIAEIQPGETLYHSPNFIDQPWSEEVVQSIGEKHSKLLLNHARKIINQPWAARVITPALRKEYRGERRADEAFFAGWPTEYINTFTDDKLAIDVIRLVDKTDTALVDDVLIQVFDAPLKNNEDPQKILSSAKEHRGERWADEAFFRSLKWVAAGEPMEQ